MSYPPFDTDRKIDLAFDHLPCCIRVRDNAWKMDGNYYLSKSSNNYVEYKDSQKNVLSWSSKYDSWILEDRFQNISFIRYSDKPKPLHGKIDGVEFDYCPCPETFMDRFWKGMRKMRHI